MNVLKGHVKYTQGKAAWRETAEVNATHNFATGSFTWGTNTLLLKDNDLATSLTAVSSSPTLVQTNEE